MFCVIAYLLRGPVLTGHPGKCCEDPNTGFEGAAEGAGHLRFPGETPTVWHRELENPEPGPGCPHLHFEVPAIGHLAHPETRQRIGTDCPEGAHVCIAHGVDKADCGANDVAGERLMGSHSALLAHSTGARADHEIVFVLDNRLDQARDRLRPVAAISIEKHQYLRPARVSRSRTPGAGPT